MLWTKVHAFVKFRLYSLINTHTHPFNGPLSRTTQVSRYRNGKTNLDFTEARDSGIRWAICKSAPCSRQITTPAPHHSVFYRPDACHPTNSVNALTNSVNALKAD